MFPMFLNKIFCKSGTPIHLIWFITGRCNLQCSHCFYYSNTATHPDEFSFDEIKKTIAKLFPLLSVSLTGGEPFLRDDLLEITKLLSRERLTQNIVLYTNGYLPDRIISASEKILLFSPKVNIYIGVSIDGFEEEHDKFRNKKGSYKNAIETITGLKKLKSKFSNFNPGVGITLHAGNQNVIHSLRKDIYDRFGIHPGTTMIRGTVNSPTLKNVNSEIYKELVKNLEKEANNSKNKTFYKRIVATREVLGQKLAYKTFITAKRFYSCYAGSLMGIIYENGDVFPCEMLNNFKLGNLRETNYDLRKIWQTAKANEIRKWIKSRKCACTYECQFTCNTLYNIKFLPIFLNDLIK